MANRMLHAPLRYAHLLKEFAREEIQTMNGLTGICHKNIMSSGKRLSAAG